MKSLLLSLFLCTSISAAPIWGTTSTELSGQRDDTLITSGSWIDNFTISWDINAVDDGWVYTYGLLTDGQDVSHFLLEVTEGADPIGHNGELLNPQWWSMAGNQPLPDDLFGVKADHGATYYSFYSDRDPVWGNFYAKSGNGTYAYNSGFNHLSDNPFDYIVRPDGITTPEPMTAMLLGFGAIFALHRRR